MDIRVWVDSLGPRHSKSNLQLPKGKVSHVRVEAIEREVRLYLNNALASKPEHLPTDRAFGASTLYVASPWEPVANATISRINLVPITKFSS